MTDPRSPTQLFSAIGRKIRETLSTSTGSFYNKPDALQFLNEEWAELYYAVVELRQNHFIQEQQFDLVLDQEDYNLPDNCLLPKQWEWLTQGDARSYYKIKPSTLEGRGDDADNFFFTLPSGVRIYPYDNGFRVRPTPQENIEDALRLHYVPLPIAMHTGTAANATPSMTALYLDQTPTFGYLADLDHFYRGATVITTGGTGSGQKSEITAFDPDSTPASLATVAFTSNIDNTTTYEILSQIPFDQVELLVLGAIRRHCEQDQNTKLFEETWGKRYEANRQNFLSRMAKRHFSGSTPIRILQP